MISLCCNCFLSLLMIFILIILREILCIFPLEILFLFLNNRRSLALTFLIMIISLKCQLCSLTIKPPTSKIHNVFKFDPIYLNYHLHRVQYISYLCLAILPAYTGLTGQSRYIAIWIYF